MRPEVFQIQVPDRSLASYFPGETVEGILHVRVGSNQQCYSKGITVTFEGKASVRWTEKHSSGTGENRTTTSTTYSATEKYFDATICLLDTGNVKTLILPGHYEYPFKFILPHNLPSSFTGTCGKVEYKMEAKLLRSTFKMNYKAKVPFTVNGILDLNTHFGAAEPVESRKHKHLCCLCCRSGPVGFVINLPKRGFVSGEFLSFVAEINNQSNKRVKEVRAYIVQKTVYHATTKSKPDLGIVICRASGPSVAPGDSEIWAGNIFQIPPLPPTLLAGGCRIIDVNYVLKIELHLAGGSINLRHDIPIIIGSIPLRSTFEEIFRLQSNLNPTVPTVNNIPSALPMLYFQENFNYPDMPPPSYAEAIGAMNQTDDSEVDWVKPNFEPNQNGPNNRSAEFTSTSEEQEQTPEFIPKYITYGQRPPDSPQGRKPPRC